MLSALELNPGETVLDLGCGYGPIGIVAAKMVGPQGKVYMVDINERAVELAKQNATINGVDNVDIRVNDGLNGLNIDFDCIITNPPIRAGKQVIYKMVDDAYERLKAEGRLIMVIRMKQGAKSMEQKLQELFDEVHTIERKSGYRVLLAQKITSS
ncbi:MAG: class I SAM-dependent methyltransferase [Firmicutes bacterium]|nr:class I SAM-dependent methyltransferase [Bacillota bacterium]